jgi:hypothetical protein
MTYRVKVGEWLHDNWGVYEIIAFNEMDRFCTVTEIVFNDESDNYTYGDTLFLTREEVKNAIAWTTGKRYKYLVSEFE